MSQDEDEVNIFQEFLNYSKLEVVADSVEKRKPPEPDIVCRLTDNTQLAFELVEICKPENAAFMGSASTRSRLIEDTYQNLDPSDRTRFDLCFSGKPLSFAFAHGATTNQIRVILPKVFQELLKTSDAEHLWRPSSPRARNVVQFVRFVGRVEEPHRPSFNIAGIFDPDDVVIRTVTSKLDKSYESPHPIELLAYFGHFAGEPSTTWEHSLYSTLSDRSLGVFRRVWILGWKEIKFDYPR